MAKTRPPRIEAPSGPITDEWLDSPITREELDDLYGHGPGPSKWWLALPVALFLIIIVFAH